MVKKVLKNLIVYLPPDNSNTIYLNYTRLYVLCQNTFCGVKILNKLPNVQFSALEKLRTSTNRGLRNASEYAIWKIKGSRHEDVPVRENLPQEPPPTYEESIREPEQATPNTTKLMISYQWDSKQIARKIRDGLVNNGFTVWMDETHLSKAVCNMSIAR